MIMAWELQKFLFFAQFFFFLSTNLMDNFFSICHSSILRPLPLPIDTIVIMLFHVDGNGFGRSFFFLLIVSLLLASQVIKVLRFVCFLFLFHTFSWIWINSNCVDWQQVVIDLGCCCWILFNNKVTMLMIFFFLFTHTKWTFNL